MDFFTLKNKLKNIKPTNKNPLYQSHLYWSQKPYNIADILIEELSNKNEIIFDPFMGSGVNIFQAVLNDRKVIGSEINDLPIFIIDTLLKKYKDMGYLQELFEEFVKSLDEIHDLYETSSVEPEINKTGVVQKVIFDRENPFSEFQLKEILYKVPDNNKILSKKPDLFDIEKFHFSKIDNIKDFELLQNSRLAVQKSQSIKTLFTPRTLTIINHVLNFINSLKNKEDKNLIKYTLMSSLHLIKITDLKSNSQWPLWTPKNNCLEKNAITILKKRIKLLTNALNFMEESLYHKDTVQFSEDFGELNKNGDLLIFKKPAQNINTNDIPDNSVDLIITDPPYLGQVLYSEYMQLYYPFLDLKYNLEDEIVVSNAKNRKKDRNNYFKLMDKSFENMSRVLKNGNLLCMYFHDSNLNVWKDLIDLTNKNGLYFIGMCHIYKKVTLKNILSPKNSLQGDAILIFKKDKSSMNCNENEDIDTIVINIINHVRYELEIHGKLSTTQLIDDGLMEYIIQNNWLGTLSEYYKTIPELIENYFSWDKYEGKWQLK